MASLRSGGLFLPCRPLLVLLPHRHHPPGILALDHVLDGDGGPVRRLAELDPQLTDGEGDGPDGVGRGVELRAPEGLNALPEDEAERLDVPLLLGVQRLAHLLVGPGPGLGLDLLEAPLPVLVRGALRDAVAGGDLLVAALRAEGEVELERVVGNPSLRHDTTCMRPALEALEFGRNTRQLEFSESFWRL